MSANEPPLSEARGQEAGEGLLARAAGALATDPTLIGAALARHRAATGWDEAALARWLGVERAMLHGLALCTMPERASRSFAADVLAIARATGCSPQRLEALLIATADAPPER